ncbi:MAG: methylenetetrahydrofolate reductase [Ruminococcus sp.]|nr:methylenetetrahydrofolate reductase [NAD(P)H] [Ruminococcus sp.]
MRTADIFRRKTVFSLEIFPPKRDMNESVIYSTLDELTDIHPDFISVTCGAGGGKNGSRTIRIASDIINRYDTTSVAHLPCIGLTKERAAQILDCIKESGIENVLALRGDIPDDNGVTGDFSHADELITFIRENYDLNIIAACYPEVHPESRNTVEDIIHLKNKVDCGVGHLITQLFLDNRHFYDFRENAQLAGIDVPIEAGIMPVTNKKQIERIVKLCAIELPAKYVRVLERYEDDPVALRDAGIAYAVDQITELAAEGVDGIHLYTMNDPHTAHKIYDAVKNVI